MLAVYEWALRRWNLRALSVSDNPNEKELCARLNESLAGKALSLLPMLSPEPLKQPPFEVFVSDFVSSKGRCVDSPAFCLSRLDYDDAKSSKTQYLHFNPRHGLLQKILEQDPQEQFEICQLILALNQWPIGGIDHPECLDFHWGVRVLGGPIQVYSKAISEKMWVEKTAKRERPTLVLFPKDHGNEFSKTHLQRWTERDNAVLAEIEETKSELRSEEYLGNKLLSYSPLLLPHLKQRSMHDLVREDKWYGLSAFFSNTIIDRTQTLSESLRLHVLDPIVTKEEISQFDSDLSSIMIEHAQALLNQSEETGKELEVFWSGGIDSTAILVALLQASRAEQRARVTVRLDQQSIDEHPQFYRSVIQSEFPIEELNGLSISKEMNENRISVTGECGDQIFGSATMKKCFGSLSLSSLFGAQNRFSAGLLAPWQDTALATMIDKGIVTDKNDWLEWFCPQLAKSPLPIVSTFDLLWWLNFSLKWQTVTLRCFNNSWSQLKNQSEPGHDPLKGIEHFFRARSFQRWSCKPENHARKFEDFRDWKSYKEPLKRFIYEFDKDRAYYKYKEKVGSLKRDTELPMACPLMGIDDRHNALFWGKHSLWNRRYEEKYGASLKRFLIS